MASIPGLLPGTSAGRVLLRTSALAVVILLALFVIASITLKHAIGGTFRYDHAVRQAELYRSYLLRLQLDEETGLRGFSLTANRTFLLPLRRARARYPAALGSLKKSLATVDPPMLQVLVQEQRINEQWLTQIMVPMVTDPKRSDDRSLQQHGKVLIDRYRAANAVMGSSLNGVADAADRAANILIARIVLWSVAFGLVLAAALIYYALVQARLVQELDERTQSFERERRITTALQRAFLFETLPRVHGIEFDATYLSAQEELRVGGDWYGAFHLPDGRIFFTMGDVLGHGTEAAVLMSRARQTILSFAVHEPDPALVLAQANDVLRLRAQTMVTAICGFIDPETHEVVYASAGHPPPLEVARGGEASYLPHEGVPLGVTADFICRAFTHHAAAGSTLVFYTDGIIEFDRRILDGERRLRDVAGAVMETNVVHPASEILERVLAGAPQTDDVAILTIHFVGEAAQTPAGDHRGLQRLLSQWTVDRNDALSASHARTAFAAFLAKRSLGVDAYASELIFGELVANGLEHGTGVVRARLYDGNEGPILVVSDTGCGIAPRHGTLPLPEEPRGRGLHIVKALARDVRFLDPGASIVAVALPLRKMDAGA